MKQHHTADLCRKYTDLCEEDIRKIEEIASMLPYFSELSHRDIFIDCFDRTGEFGVVVAHNIPENDDDLYSVKVTGKIVLPEKEPSVFLARSQGVPIRDLKGITQENKTVMQQAVPVTGEGGEVIAVIVEEQDITSYMNRVEYFEDLVNKQNKDKVLLEFNNIPNTVTNYVKEGVIVFDGNQEAVHVNQEARNLYDRMGRRDEILGMKFDDLMLTGRDDKDRIMSGEITRQEAEAGSLVLDIKYEFMGGAREKGIIMVLEDITELKKKESELVYKSAAVREMHHRIKNNLQIVTSILNMQIRRSSCEETRQALNDNINRLNGIAMIHETLMKGDLNEKISLKDILEKVVKSIIWLTETVECNIDMEVKGSDIVIDFDRAVSVVIVVNELITNSVKHAFRGKTRGSITVNIEKGIRYSTIIIKDDGNGFDYEKVSRDSLGLQLVNLTVKDKLKGDIKVSSDGTGTSASFDFLLSDY